MSEEFVQRIDSIEEIEEVMVKVYEKLNMIYVYFIEKFIDGKPYELELPDLFMDKRKISFSVDFPDDQKTTTFYFIEDKVSIGGDEHCLSFEDYQKLDKKYKDVIIDLIDIIDVTYGLGWKKTFYYDPSNYKKPYSSRYR